MILDKNTQGYFKAMLAKTGDGTYQVPTLDESTHAFNFVDYVHHELHGGSLYGAYYTITTAAANDHLIGFSWCEHTPKGA